MLGIIIIIKGSNEKAKIYVVSTLIILKSFCTSSGTEGQISDLAETIVTGEAPGLIPNDLEEIEKVRTFNVFKLNVCVSLLNHIIKNHLILFSHAMKFGLTVESFSGSCSYMSFKELEISWCWCRESRQW